MKWKKSLGQGPNARGLCLEREYISSAPGRGRGGTAIPLALNGRTTGTVVPLPSAQEMGEGGSAPIGAVGGARPKPARDANDRQTEARVAGPLDFS